MSFLNKMIDSMAKYNELRAHEVVLQELRRKSHRELADLGFDPHLIEQGVKGWPWRVVESDTLAEIGALVSLGNRITAANAKVAPGVAQGAESPVTYRAEKEFANVA